MKYLKIIIIILFITITTGCYNYRELNDLGITTSVGISKKGDTYNLVIEVLKTETLSSDENKIETILYESSGSTIQEALRRAILLSPKRLYANHLYMILIDEEVARDGISSVMDLFFRDAESRKQFYVLISKDDIKKVLKNSDGITAKSLVERLKVNDDYLSNTTPITFSKLLTKYVNPNIEMVIPSVKLDNNDVVISNTGIFKGDKLVGYIDEHESLYYSLIMNNVSDTVLTSLYKNEYTTIEIDNTDTAINVSNNTFKIKIDLSGYIAEINSKVDLTNPKVIEEIETTFEKDLKCRISYFIKNIINKYDTDIFGFKDLIYKKDFKNYKEDMDLKDLEFNIDIDISLKYKGNGAKELNA